MRKQLTKYKGKNISFAGRVYFIIFVLNSLPLFYISFFKAPNTIIRDIQKIQRKLLWGWGA